MVSKNYNFIGLKKETYDLLKACRDEYLKHHPEFKNIPISNNKIVYEMAIFYLKY